MVGAMPPAATRTLLEEETQPARTSPLQGDRNYPRAPRQLLDTHWPRLYTGILRDKLKLAERLLELTVESAREAAPEAGQRREAYYCNDQGCWVAEQYFCDETGCWITDEAAVQLPKEAPKEVSKKAPAAKKEKTIVQQGIFAPAVGLAVEVMGRKELNAFRASVIAEHTKVISAFVDTSESKFGQIALKWDLPSNPS